MLCAASLHAASRGGWIATWATSPESARSNSGDPLGSLENQTVRERVRVSVGGTRICIRLSNVYGSTPLTIGAVTVGDAEPNDPAGIRPGSLHTVLFQGLGSTTIPAGGSALSDPVAFPISYGAELSISLYFPQKVTTPTVHMLALKHAVVSPKGDHTSAEKMEGGVSSTSSVLVSDVLVPAQPSERLVVTFGDSITDGDQSTVDADHNWPSDLIRRLGQTPKAQKIAVVNEGIAGNRLLSDDLSHSYGVKAVARFDGDALALPGVTHIVLLEGINDIGFPGAKADGGYLADPATLPTAETLIGAYRQLISRAHAREVKLIGATITPFEGVGLPGYYSESKEAIRQAVNNWIRTSGSFDGVIDFDAVLRDPQHPSQLLARFASPDHLHPNDAGYQAMADAVPLALFQ